MSHFMDGYENLTHHNWKICIYKTYLGIDNRRTDFLCVTKNRLDFIRISIFARPELIIKFGLWYSFVEFVRLEASIPLCNWHNVHNAESLISLFFGLHSRNFSSLFNCYCNSSINSQFENMDGNTKLWIFGRCCIR